MIRPAPLSLATTYVMTATLCGAAVLVALGSLAMGAGEPFVLDGRAFWAEPWRMLTTILPHGNPAHLIFNLYWAWTLGVAVEHLFGKQLWVLLVVLAAVASSTAEYAFTASPIGLSGVVYALFGFLWVVSYRVPRMKGMLDRLTVKVFLGWFVVCIVLTELNLMNVANIAHGVGGVIGAGVALSVTSRGWRRHLFTAATSTALALCVFLASAGRGIVNPSGVAQEHLWTGGQHFDAGSYGAAATEFRAAIAAMPKAEAAHIGLIASLAAEKRLPEAKAAWINWEKVGGEPGSGLVGSTWAELGATLGYEALGAKRWDITEDIGQRLVASDGENANAWRLLGGGRELSGDRQGALAAYGRVLELQPTDKGAQEAQQRLRTLPEPK